MSKVPARPKLPVTLLSLVSIEGTISISVKGVYRDANGDTWKSNSFPCFYFDMELVPAGEQQESSMSQVYDEIATDCVEGYDIVIDYRPEDLDPTDAFDTPGAAEIIEDIREGRLAWFTLRVRAMLYDIELGSAYLGACCYRSPQDVMTDPNGIVKGMIAEAVAEAMKIDCLMY